MSRIQHYANLDAAVRFRIDDPKLEPLASDLHTAALERTEDATPETPADLAWTAAGNGLVQISLAGTPWESPLAETEAFFQSENLITRLFCSKLEARLQLHAAAVATPAGNAWLICGPSRAGKTSLTIAYMLEGWNWLSDELILVEADAPRLLKGFRRNFNLKEPSWKNFPETADLPHRQESWSGHHQANIRFIDPASLRPDAFRAEASLAGILLPRYSPTATPPSLHRVEGLAATQAILPEVSDPSAFLLATIANWIRDLPVFQVIYQDPRTVPAAVREQHSLDASFT